MCSGGIRSADKMPSAPTSWSTGIRARQGHGHSSGLSTRPARTGFIHTYSTFSPRLSFDRSTWSNDSCCQTVPARPNARLSSRAERPFDGHDVEQRSRGNRQSTIGNWVGGRFTIVRFHREVMEEQ
jgi:hypothetical protein